MNAWKKITAILLVVLLLVSAPVAYAQQIAPRDGDAPAVCAVDEPANTKDNSATIWIVLLCISLLENGVLIWLLLWKKGASKREQVDDVPLVEYDIDDDVI